MDSRYLPWDATLVTNSEEFGDNDGLDLIKGEVKRLKSTNKKRYKIPHVGWNSINFKQNTNSDNFLINVKIIQIFILHIPLL